MNEIYYCFSDLTIKVIDNCFLLQKKKKEIASALEGFADFGSSVGTFSGSSLHGFRMVHAPGRITNIHEEHSPIQHQPSISKLIAMRVPSQF